MPSLNALTGLAVGLSAIGSAVATPMANLATCLHDANVPFKVPGDDNYANTTQTFNLRFKYVPAAFATPNTAKDVSAAVKCANQNNIKVQARGGGHSFAGYSEGGADGSLILSMEKFSQVEVGADNVAAVGAGLRLGDMALSLYNNDPSNRRAMPHGSCPGVGIAGHALHGGYGLPSRNWGLTVDQIVGLDVVLANGTAITASASENTDVFYAMKGAGDSFGIATTFHMKTQPAPESLVYFAYSFDAASLFTGTGEAPADIFMHLQAFSANETVMDRRTAWGVYIDAASFSLSGIFFGSEDEYKNKIEPEMLRTLPARKSNSFKTTNWPDLLTNFANGQPVSQPLGTEYNIHDDFFAKSLVSFDSSPVSREAYTAYFKYIIDNKELASGSSWYCVIDLFGGVDSQVNAGDAATSSYGNRGEAIDFQHYGFTSNTGGEFPSDIQPFIQGLNDAIPKAMPNTRFGAYSNYVDPSLSANEAHDQYFGAEIYAKLAAIKKAVDPKNTFWNPQAVGVDSTTPQV